MSFIHYQKFASQGVMAIWEITENFQQLSQQLPPEWLLAADFQQKILPQQQLEWLASRVALYMLAQKVQFPLSSITKDEFGKPFCPESSLQFSLSHAFPWVAVVLHPTYTLGIDIEKEQPKLQRIAHRVFHTEELAWATTLYHQTAVWCAKETMYKWYGQRGLDFKTHLQVAPLGESWTGQVQLPSLQYHLRLYHHHFEGYHVVWGHQNSF